MLYLLPYHVEKPKKTYGAYRLQKLPISILSATYQHHISDICFHNHCNFFWFFRQIHERMNDSYDNHVNARGVWYLFLFFMSLFLFHYQSTLQYFSHYQNDCRFIFIFTHPSSQSFLSPPAKHTRTSCRLSTLPNFKQGPLLYYMSKFNQFHLRTQK